MQDQIFCQIQTDCDHQCKKTRKQDELIYSLIGFLPISLPQILPHNNGAPCGQCRKEINQQDKNIINQRNTGNRMFPYCCYHNRVGHTYQ